MRGDVARLLLHVKFLFNLCGYIVHRVCICKLIQAESTVFAWSMAWLSRQRLRLYTETPEFMAFSYALANSCIGPSIGSIACLDIPSLLA